MRMKHDPPQTLMVASTGGHLEELYRLRPRLGSNAASVEWVTFDGSQSRSLLADEAVHYLDYIGPRGYRALISSAQRIDRILRAGSYSRVVTTGSAVALSFLPIARAHGLPCHYIESAARVDQPSMTGRVVSRIPGVRLYTQYPGWSDPRWCYRGSLFDGYCVLDDTNVTHAERIVVTLGTMQGYGFRRAVEAVLRLLPQVATPSARIIWQVGATDVTGLEVDSRQYLTAAEMQSAIADADLVIAHAGIGSALAALSAGKCPVLLSRLHRHGEHVDDHQLMIARELDKLGLAVGRDPDDLVANDLERAMSTRIGAHDEPIPFELVE